MTAPGRTIPDSAFAAQTERTCAKRVCRLQVSTARDCADDEQRFLAGDYFLRQGQLRRLMREVFFASEESQERPTLAGDVITNRSLQHGIASLEGVEDGTNGYFARDLKFDFRPGLL